MELDKPISEEELEKQMKTFIGKINQTPPVKSRVKRQEREREIHLFEIIEESEKENERGKIFLFRTKCEGVTYVRKLIHDLGLALNTGAHMLELRRTHAGIFSETDKEYPIVNLYDFEKAFNNYKKGNDGELRAMLIPGEIVANIFPIVLVKNELIEKFYTGKPIYENDVKSDLKQMTHEGKYCVFSEDKKSFVGIYKRVYEDDIVLRADFVMAPIK